MVKFQAGDRAVVNSHYDFLAIDRDKLVGAVGTVFEVVEDAPELLFFKADDPNVGGHGPDNTWALMDHELDKLED